MKLWTIFRFEFGNQVRRKSTWLYIAVLLAFTIVMNLATTPGDGIYPNNTFHITAITVIGGLIWVVMGASIAGEAAARDVQTRMYPLTYTSPVSRMNYLGGRFLAAFAVNALLIFSLPLGVMLSFYLPGMEQGELLPFRPWAYGSVYLLIALPNAFVTTALQFSLAANSRRVMASYAASLLLAFFAQIIAIAAAKLFGNWDLVKLLDPIGITGIVGNELQTWTATEKNSRLIALGGMFLWNRVLWSGMAVGALWLTYKRFSFTSPDMHSWMVRFKRRPNVQTISSAQTATVRPTSFSVPQVKSSFGITTWFRQTLTITGASFGKIAKHPLGLTLVGAVALVSAVFGDKIINEFGIPLIPTTKHVLDYLAVPVSNINTPWVIIPLLILYFSGELVWHERDAGISEIADAAPVPEWVLLTGKLLGLSLIILLWIAILMIGGIGMQLGMGYRKLEIGLYLQILFGLQLVDYLLFAVLALVLHIVVNQKYIGYLLVLIVFIFLAFPASFGVEHTMLIFGKDPGWWYTDMRGFGPGLGPWLWFKVYWIAWAMMLAVAARLLWARGREQSIKFRAQSVKRRLTGPTIWASMIGAGLILTLGSFIFYNTNVLNVYKTGSDINEQKAAYERHYSQYRNTPQPQLTGTKLHVEIYPERQQVEIRATYTLVNKHTEAIDSIHVGSISGIAPAEAHFNRPATAVLNDKELSYYIYALEQPLQPGDSLEFNFVIHYRQKGFHEIEASALVMENGTYFTNYDLLPTIGYQRFREINDAVTRKKYKLPARPALASLYDLEARKRPLSADQSTFEAVVGTSKEEVAVAPGKLLQTWTKGDRRYFHYKTDDSIGWEYAILSGKYEMQESKWKNVAIRIYYHPGHAQNIDRMLRSVKASLELFTEQFGPYPYEYLTIAERAGSGAGATADAGIIYYGEQYALMNPDDGPAGFDLPYYILAHEVAHQWWGLARLTPAHVEGAGVLIEGLAVYSGMQVLGNSYGESHLQRYVDYLHASYELPRSLAAASLLQASEPFLYYRKSGLAMYALSEYIGIDKVNGALERLLQKRSSGELLLPTTLNLYKELQEVTPDSLNYLLQDLFKENTYWRLKTKELATEQTQDGSWQVTLKVQAQKVVVDRTGKENEVRMDDWLEVGLYEEGKGLDDPLYLQMHRIRSGEQVIKVTVPRKPGSGGIDPNHLMIDLRLDDNMKQFGGG